MREKEVDADDTALEAESAEQLQCLVTEVGRVCERRKLRVNVEGKKQDYGD